ncbi:MAG: TIGR01212 family radical SAM protein [Reichenbachiella sp.]
MIERPAAAEKRYLDYSSYIKNKFGGRVQKISINAGFTCPNRDGSKGTGGCTYCNNNTFNPDYCKPTKSITTQLDEGIAFFSKRHKPMGFMAYFQAYTNTYADIAVVKEMYSEAISHPEVVGLVIGTRPDCINEELIDYLSLLAKQCYISLEFGIESTLNKSLERINRCHSYEDSIAAYEMSKNKGLHLGAHLIIGLPGESREEMLRHATAVSKLPIDTLKIHQLQIVKHTMMAIEYQKEPENFELFELEEYIDFISEFVAHLRPDIIIERFISQSPYHLLIAPKWGVKNFQMTEIVIKRMEKNALWQGCRL